MHIEEIYHLYTQSYKVSTDSRSIPENGLYFAFKGAHFNGNEYAQEAREKGALACFVEEKEFENISQQIYWVESTLITLQKLANYHRNQLKIPFVGLTGSNGKTTTKELIAAVTSMKYKTLCTAGNYNNHLGVPLTILRIDPSYEMAIIEMGANHQGEIKELSAIAQPDIGYITNFGKAHLEGFGGVEGVIKGKSELYEYLLRADKTVLCNEADDLQVKQSIDITHRITFGLPSSDYYFELETHSGNTLSLSFDKVIINTQFTGNYNFSNASAAMSLGLHFGVSIEKMKEALESYVPENQRSQILIQGGKTIVLDAYNANPSSMTEALMNFAQFPGNKTVILGDMFELGKYSELEHQRIVELVEQLSINPAIFVGNQFYEHKDQQGYFYKTKEELEKALDHSLKLTDMILIKGSRAMALETLLPLLN